MRITLYIPNQRIYSIRDIEGHVKLYQHTIHMIFQNKDQKNYEKLVQDYGMNPRGENRGWARHDVD